MEVQKEINKKNQKVVAIIYILFSGLGFALMSFFARIAGDLPTMEKAFFRNGVALIFVSILMLRNGVKVRVPKDAAGWLFLRCTFGTVGLISNFYALDHMNIADANMLNKMSPFFAIMASAVILKERVNAIEWGTVFAAFAGALLIIKPSFNVQVVYGLVGALGGLCAGFAYTFLRRTTQKGVEGQVIVFSFSLYSTIVCLPFLITDFVPMSPKQLICLLLAGISATVGQLCITKAYTKAPAKEISVFDYSQIVYAAILGIVFLHQVPDIYSILGYIVIIGIAVFRWQYTLRQDAKSGEKA